MSLLNLKSQMQGEAIQGIGQVEQAEQQQEIAQEQLEMQSKQAKMSAVGTGAGIGMMAYGPVGALVGAGVGYLTTLM